MAKEQRKRKHGPGKVLGVSEFKRRCLEVFETVRRRGEEIVVTKRGEPVARVIPVGRPGTPLRGMLKDRAVIRGDIVHVDWTDEWESAR